MGNKNNSLINIEKVNWVFMSFILIFISIVCFLYANYWFIEWVLSKLYFTNDFLLYIKDNLKYVITISFTLFNF